MSSRSCCFTGLVLLVFLLTALELCTLSFYATRDLHIVCPAIFVAFQQYFVLLLVIIEKTGNRNCKDLNNMIEFDFVTAYFIVEDCWLRNKATPYHSWNKLINNFFIIGFFTKIVASLRPQRSFPKTKLKIST